MAISLFIAGDVVPKGIRPEDFDNNGEQIFAEMKPYISGADFSIVNFEAPIIKEKNTPIRKDGPCLGVAPTTVSVLKKIGFNVFTLANNHFFDQGQKGVENTINECVSQNVKVVGGGKTVLQAREPLILMHKDGKVAIINACEHEFSIANIEHGGSNPIDLINLQEDISAIRSKVDYVVLILHGGIEGFQYPTPRMKREYRHFVELGADVVINHHQHCVCGYEIYKGKPIYYGLGNFYFPGEKQSRPLSWFYGYAVQITLGDKIDHNIIPYKQTSQLISIRDVKEFENEMSLLNIPIHNDFLLQQKFDDLLIDKEYFLKLQLMPSFLRGKLFSRLIIRRMLGKLFFGKYKLSTKNNLICESHIESIVRLFEIITK